jgi:hypothetical protein
MVTATTRRPRKARNRARYTEHFKYNVQWLMSTGALDFEDPLCFASFRTLRDAEQFEVILNAQHLRHGWIYGVEVVPL